MSRVIYVFIIFLSFVSEVWACGCAAPQTLEDARWSYAFIGRVISVERSGKDGLIEELVTFAVIKNITDVKAREQKVIFRKGHAPCDILEPKFSIGDVYTITSMGNIDTNLLYNDYCDLRQKY